MSSVRKCYPFTAIVGQENMKKALVLNIINPMLGGVLIRGEKGTAKSTAVRSLAELLPGREQVEECIFGCDPWDESTLCQECRGKKEKGMELGTASARMRVVDLPVSATEDRVVGTLDIEHAIKKGEKKFEPGILAMANRNILYVDEVNLLDDHVVDVLLDAAAMGVNTIEREGVSFSHPARFVLVGTMNPEEGDLRPQLLDRFGLVVEVAGEKDPALRVEVIKRRLEFEKDPETFSRAYENSQSMLKERISRAQELLPEVVYGDRVLEMAARICIEMNVDGHRADIGIIKTAVTIAAFNGRKEVEEEDIIEASGLVLPHRMRRRPFEEGHMDFSKVADVIKEMKG